MRRDLSRRDSKASLFMSTVVPGQGLALAPLYQHVRLVPSMCNPRVLNTKSIKLSKEMYSL